MALMTTLLARDMMGKAALRSVQQPHVDRQVRTLAQTTATRRTITTGHKILTRILPPSITGSQQLPMSSFTSSSSSSSGSSMTSQRATFVSQSFPVTQSSPFDPQSRAAVADPSSSTTSTSDSDSSAATTATTTTATATKKKRSKKKFIPRKAAVELNDKTRKFFKSLLQVGTAPPAKEEDPIIGIMLHYDQSQTGEPRMVFSFGFVTAEQLGPDDEAVSLEVLADGVTPKAPVDAMHDGLPKLYVSGNAFLKVLGAKLDVDTENVIPILYDRDGNLMDPNA